MLEQLLRDLNFIQRKTKPQPGAKCATKPNVIFITIRCGLRTKPQPKSATNYDISHMFLLQLHWLSKCPQSKSQHRIPIDEWGLYSTAAVAVLMIDTCFAQNLAHLSESHHVCLYQTYRHWSNFLKYMRFIWYLKYRVVLWYQYSTYVAIV